MVKAVCKDYGFDCDFVCEGDLDSVIDDFGKHCTEEHGTTRNPNKILDE